MSPVKDLIRTTDWDRKTAERIFATAAALKTEVKDGHFRTDLKGLNAALIFQKPSLRTRVTFDIGINQLGGHAVYLGPSEISMGVRESVYDVARNLERWVNLIVARVFSQKHVEELAEVASVPVINALSDEEHPCQVYADYLAIKEQGLSWPEVKLAYIGDGNNVCASLMFLGAILGIDFRMGCPEKYCLPESVLTEAKKLAAVSGGKISIHHDPIEAVTGANAVYTDIWASMGWENEAAERAKAFRTFQVNKALMDHAEAGALAMHDLPAHRGEEITDEVMDGPTSIVFNQAENRLHAQKAIMLECLGKI
jgi:ornithine carbamoyltransferase